MKEKATLYNILSSFLFFFFSWFFFFQFLESQIRRFKGGFSFFNNFSSPHRCRLLTMFSVTLLPVLLLPGLRHTSAERQKNIKYYTKRYFFVHCSITINCTVMIWMCVIDLFCIYWLHSLLITIFFASSLLPTASLPTVVLCYPYSACLNITNTHQHHFHHQHHSSPLFNPLYQHLLASCHYHHHKDSFHYHHHHHHYTLDLFSVFHHHSTITTTISSSITITTPSPRSPPTLTPQSYTFVYIVNTLSWLLILQRARVK